MTPTRRDVARLSLGALLLPGRPAAAIAAGWRLGFTTPPDRLDGELALLEGDVPPGLRGQYYRIGPAQFERAGERLGHWFDGDGMIQKFAIRGGRVHHSGRFIDTDKRRKESAAGRFLFPGYGFSPRTPAETLRPDDLNAANTNVLPLNGEVWALWEGGSPWRVAASDLQTIGRQTFDGELNGVAFSAHPKVLPDGEIWNFGLLLAPRAIVWNLRANGAVRKAAVVELPAASLMHDFAVTSRSIVLLLPPMLLGNAPARSLVDRYQWHGDEPLRIVVLDKADLTIRHTYELPARFLFHIGNAWEDASGTIRVDTFVDADATFAVKTARDLALGVAMSSPTARLVQFSLHPDGRAHMSAFPSHGEFPRINPLHAGTRHRYTYGVVDRGIARWDLESGEHEPFVLGANYWSDEPVFVPWPDAAAEDDGWVLATALNYGAGRTELNIFDAGRIPEGPVARLACAYALPLGFHGTFVADA